MSPSNRSLMGFGLGVGLAGAATAVGIVTDRVNRRRAEALETGDSLVAVPTRELVVLADDGVPLHVEVDDPVEGSETEVEGRLKPTVVLTHGFCLTSECWVFQRRALTAAGHRVVVWDHRGHGRSEKGAPESYTIDQLGLDLARVITDVAPEGQLVLAGHSMGGMSTMALAQSHPHVVRTRVIGFGAIATSPGGMPIAGDDLAASVGRVLVERLGPRAAGLFSTRPELLRALLRANKDLTEFLVERYSFASPVPRSVVRLTAKMLLGIDLTVLSGFTPAFADYDKTGALPVFRGIETLVFNGDQDILTPPEHSEAIVRALPGAEHVIVRDAGHVIMLEHPDLLSSQLIALAERGVRAQERGVDITAKPRTRRLVTNLDKLRRIEQVREQRREHRGESFRRKRDDA
ncbi:MAG: alpha/beta hydrolase [Lapillicoccus sp.]